MKFTQSHDDRDKITFFNYDAIADADGIVQKWHQPKKHPQPVLKPERDYESIMTLPISVLPSPDSRKLVCYYESFISQKFSPQIHKRGIHHLHCAAESEDGIHWERPNLGLVSFDGSKANNITQLGGHHFAPILLDRNDPDPKRRYKTLTLGWPGQRDWPNVPGCSRCFSARFSADGLRWGKPTAIPSFAETGDTCGLSYDERTKRFLFTTRPQGYWIVHESIPEFRKRPVKKKTPDGRWIGLTTSKDFLHWTPFDLILVRDSRDEEGIEFYCFHPFRYGNVWLGLLRRYDNWHGTMDTELVHSLDGLRWTRAPRRQAFIQPGELDDFDWCFSDLVNGSPTRCGDQLLFYFEGRQHVHSLPNIQGRRKGGMDTVMGVATLRVDGFVSLEAGSMGGDLLTEPLPIAGRTLAMNARTVGEGSMQIELLSSNLKPLTRQKIIFRGDQVNFPVEFGRAAKLPRTADGQARLRFTLDRAALYSLTIGK